MMKYFGIKTNGAYGKAPYIWWISDSESTAWMNFFQCPSKEKECNTHRLPLEEAIRAYKAIGYKCVELEVKEKEDDRQFTR